MNASDLHHLTLSATLAAQKAGYLLEQGFYSSYSSTLKKEGVHNLVTEFDKKSEDLIINMLSKNYPDHSFFGEESGHTHSKKDTITWIIDPLDGTVNFAHRIPCFSVSIAAVFQNEALVGVVYNPMTKELFIAQKGLGAYLNGSRLQVSETKKLADAFLATGFPYSIRHNPHHCIEHFVHMIKTGVPIRRLGSAAIDLAYVAAGRFDAFWEVSLQPWDFAAGALLIEEAGGRISDYDNKTPSFLHETTILASNNLLHMEMLSHLLDKS